MISTRLVLPKKVPLKQAIRVFSYLKIHKKTKLLLKSDNPQISSNRFKYHDWLNFCKDVEEYISLNIPQIRRLIMSSSIFVDTDLVEDKQLA